MDQLWGGQKADLVKCLEIIYVSEAKQPPVDAIILDGAVAVQMMAPGAARAFGEFVDMVFQPFILKQLESARIDIVLDVYRKDSLKSATREETRSGTPQKVFPSTWRVVQYSDKFMHSIVLYYIHITID